MPLYIEQSAGQAESQLVSQRRALRQAAAINPQRLAGPGVPAVPYAIELWMAHLAWLDRLAAAVQFTLDDLTAEEARGLAALRQEREKFRSAHASCAQCHSINLRDAAFCGGCGAELKR
jgi:mono/diheme cytochrome c family protein